MKTKLSCNPALWASFGLVVLLQLSALPSTNGQGLLINVDDESKGRELQDDTMETMDPTETMYPSNWTMSPSNETMYPSNWTMSPSSETMDPTNLTISPSNETSAREDNELETDAPTAPTTASEAPSMAPSKAPSRAPSIAPSQVPSQAPSSSGRPSQSPSQAPSSLGVPSQAPTTPAPSQAPTTPAPSLPDYGVCTLCPNERIVGNTDKLFLNINGDDIRCGDLEAQFFAAPTQAECDALRDPELSMEVFCECPGTEETGVCQLCETNEPDFPDNSVGDYTCIQWAQWSKVALTTEICDLIVGEGRETCCLV
jgi:hypothetical protein